MSKASYLTLYLYVYYLCTYSLLERFQSRFRSGHSTETALVRVLNDLLVIADSGACGILVMLDLTAAFDTICHSILLDRLHKWTGLSGTVLDWFESYLSARSPLVYLGSNRSQTVSLCQGVPQGSVLGPTLFSIYMLPLGKIIQKYGLSYHCYADDTQIYISSQPDLNFSSSNLSDCLMEIKGWMKLNFLKLNCSKTEVLLIGTPLNVSKCKDFRISVDNTQLSPSGQVRNFGVIFDAQLTFNSHFNNITKVAFFHLRNIVRIRPFLSRPDAEKLIHACITSRLDYCNSLFAGLPANSIKRLQFIQKFIQLFCRTCFDSHLITPSHHTGAPATALASSSVTY
uniref:Reverse transcriptase domain-containing protein n=1 Tax=Cyprinus carpio TaxID=7962 RepID=A0A8C2C1M2_CYPCA